MTEIKLKKKHIAFLSVWGVLLTLSLYAYLAYLQPSKFTPFIEQKVQEYVPELSFRQVEFTLFPRLGVEFLGIQYKNELNEYSLDIDARALLAQMSWLSLFQGDFSLAHVALTQPSISLEHKVSLKAQQDAALAKEPSKEEEEGVESKIHIPLHASKMLELVPAQLKKSYFEVLDGEFYFLPYQEKSEEVNTYFVDSINLSIDAFEKLGLTVKEFRPVLNSSQENIAKQHSFKNIMLSLKDILINEQGLTAELDFSTDLALYDSRVLSLFESKGQMSLNNDFSLKPFEQKMNIISSFNVKNQRIPSEMSFDFEYVDENTINISHANINIEQNILNLSANLTELLSNPTAHIQASFKDLSVPRWLSYTRKTPYGVMKELDKLQGSFSAVLDKKSLKTDNLQVTTEHKHIVEAKVDYNFADGHKLFVDAYLPMLNLNLLFPELEYKKSSKISYKYESLDSLLHPEDGSQSSFDYNIKVKADDITFWKYNFRSTALSITPYSKGVQIPVEVPYFFDGLLKSKVLIPYKEADRIDVEVLVENTSVEELFMPLVEKSPLSGLLNSKVNISLQPESDIEKMLAKPQLYVRASLTDGAFNPHEDAFTFKNFSAQSKVTKIAFPTTRADIFGFLGEHSLEFIKDDNVIKLHVPKTNLLYNMATGLPDSIASSYALFEYENNLPLHIISNGMFEFDFPKQGFLYKDFKGTLYNENLTGSLGLTNFANPQARGAVSISVKDLKSFLKKYQFVYPTLRDSSALSTASLAVSFDYANKIFKAKELKANLDEYDFTGSFEHDFTKAKPSVINLASSFFNADRYLDFPKKPNTAPFSAHKLLPLEFLTKLFVDAQFNVEELWLMRTPFYNASIPTSFNKGLISFTPTALFPVAGSIAVNVNMQANMRSLDYLIQAKAKDVDMLAITQAQGQDVLLAGNGTFSLDAKGFGTNEADIFKNMQGDFSAWIEHGFFMNSVNKAPVANYKNPPIKSPYVPKNLKTSFSLFSASGPIRNGILKMDNINMTGKPIGFVGQTTIDFNKWAISLAALASYENAAKIPISVNGSLSDPELSVKVLSSFTQTFTSLTNTLVNKLTDIIKKPLDLLKK